jgi:histidyl-tRNA synthetase
MPQPVRLFYVTPIFRYERPQAGRYRQHHQFGCEAIGDADPLVDAEVIQLAWTYLNKLGVTDLTLYLNSIGQGEDRKAYLKELVSYYTPFADRLCRDCKVRLVKNPLRLLDCKEESCQPIIHGAPRITDFLDDASREHFAAVQRYLGLAGIPFILNPRLVRGLDYYTRTTFEIFPSGREGSQSAVAAGGRYDGLMEQLGGPATPAVGFGSGIERAVLLLKKQEGGQIAAPRLDVYITHMGPRGKDAAVWLAGRLRAQGVSTQVSTGERSLRAQLRAANTANARYAFVIGDDEFSGPDLQDVRPVVRNLETGVQTPMSLPEFLVSLG